jgi:hypothetical protein
LITQGGDEVTEYETRVTRVVILPKGQELFSEQATIVEIDDENGGEFLRVSQQTGGEVSERIGIDKDEWLSIRRVIDMMLDMCREKA